jgi:hypothetical protein
VQEVAGSNPVAPIVLSTYIRALYCVTRRYAMARLLQSQDGRTTLLLKEGATCIDSCDEPQNFFTIVESGQGYVTDESTRLYLGVWSGGPAAAPPQAILDAYRAFLAVKSHG